MRAYFSVWLPVLVGCSFVDDFDKFRAYDGGAARRDASAAESVSNDPSAEADDEPSADPARSIDGATDESDGNVANGAPASGGANLSDGGASGASTAGSASDADTSSTTQSDAQTAAANDACSSDCDAGNLNTAPTDCPGPQRRCFPDLDGDGWADLQQPSNQCVCPQGYVELADAALREAKHDCWDADDPKAAQVHPGQTDFFADAYQKPGRGPSYDYDCSGEEEPMFTKTLPAGGCSGLLDAVLCERTAAFVEPLPACGENGVYTTCSGGVIAIGCTGTNERRKQACR